VVGVGTGTSKVKPDVQSPSKKNGKRRNIKLRLRFKLLQHYQSGKGDSWVKSWEFGSHLASGSCYHQCLVAPPLRAPSPAQTSRQADTAACESSRCPLTRCSRTPWPPPAAACSDSGALHSPQCRRGLRVRRETARRDRASISGL
jgi:hypothetical protein